VCIVRWYSAPTSPILPLKFVNLNMCVNKLVAYMYAKYGYLC